MLPSKFSPLHVATVGLLSFSCSTIALDTATIVGSSLLPECLDYKVTGICYWLLCTNFGCKVKTSAKVKHYIPELVVSGYTNTGMNPWIEVASMSAQNASAQSGGNDHSSGTYSSERFKNADAVGNPGGYAFSQFASGSGYACKSGATAYMPYFLSTLDSLAWRHGVPESFYPEALIPGMREIGSLASNWGHLYPRSGWVNQSNDYKAAAVTSQRVRDLVTRPGQPHVYQPLMVLPQPGYWPPLPIIESNLLTHKWQALSPVVQPTCAVFPGLDVPGADGLPNLLSPYWRFCLGAMAALLML